jgi:hypothetical protein
MRRAVRTLGCLAGALAATVVAGAALCDSGDADRDRLQRLERALAEERARNAANEAALRALEDRVGGLARKEGAEHGGADGQMDDDRVRKIVKEVLSDKKTAAELRKSFGVLEAGFKKPDDYQGSGFFIKSGSDFQLNINGRVQLRYAYSTVNPRDRRDGIVVAPPQKDAKGNQINPNLLNYDDRGDINIGRFRMQFSGHLYTKNLTYSLQIDASTRNNDAVQLYEAYLNWNVFGGDKDVPVEFQNALQIRFGQYHTVWGRWERPAQFQSQTSMAFLSIDYPPATVFFYPDRNLNLELRGVIGGVNGGTLAMMGLGDNNLPEDRPGTKGWLEYNLTVANGWQSVGRRYGYENDTGVGIFTTARENDLRPALVARLGLEVLKGKYIGEDGKDYYIHGRNQGDLEHHETPALGLGASFNWHRMRGQDRPVNNPALGVFYRPPGAISFDDDFADVYRLNADLSFKWMGFALSGELYYFKLHALNGPFVAGQFPTQSQDVWGWYVQGSYFVCPHVLEFYYQVSGVEAGTTPVSFAAGTPFIPGPTNLHGTNAPFNHNHVFGLNWYPFRSQNVKLTAEGAVLVNNPVPSSRAGWVSASREDQFYARFQAQIGF